MTKVQVRAWIASMAVVATSAACTAQRVVPPSAPWPGGGPDLGSVQLQVSEFSVVYTSPEDREGDRQWLAETFLDYLRAGARWSRVTKIAEKQAWQPPDAVPVRLEVQILLDETKDITGVLDALFFYPGLGALQPLTPHWGTASVDLRVRLWLADETELGEPLRVKVSAPWSMILYSWYRTGPIEEAFRRAYHLAFEQIAERVADRVRRAQKGALAEAVARREAVLAGLWSARSSTIATSSAAYSPPVIAKIDVRTATVSSSSITVARAAPGPVATPVIAELSLPAGNAALPSAAIYTPPEQIFLPPDGFNVVTQPLRGARHDFLGRYFGALGGVEVARFNGGASVESRASTRSSSEELVGSGEAVADGYRIALFRPPDRTGFFFPPTLGLMSQTITISGFREDVPVLGTARVDGSRDIGAVASDPATGAPIDINEPIAYGLKLKSAFIGQGIGMNLVVGTPDVQLFGTIAATMNLFELRHTNVRIWTSEVEGVSAVFFKSYALSAQIGLSIPAWHMGLRAALQRDAYFEFDYPKPVEFQATTTYNAEKDVFERQRAFVSGASLVTYNWQLSAVFLF